MVRKFWTITQSDEIKEICRVYTIPKGVENEIFRVIRILDDNYGIGRDLKADGGCVALILSEKDNYLEDYRKLLQEHRLQECHVEFEDIISESEGKEWHSDLYIVANDYGLTVIYSPDRKGEQS